ncbi:phage holin family protein [Nocardiopsis salina]|uniref:phage holin family protein n=1 Tax=Nocardiopsis salina TaxID=245836 RepID=UPI00034B7FE0|nr:phage holin family protein [Nocardiopsis salina]
MGNDNTNPTDRPEETEGQGPGYPEDTNVDTQNGDPRWAGPHDEAAAEGTENAEGAAYGYTEEGHGEAPVSAGAVAAQPRTGGLLGSETFTLSAVFLLAVTLMSSQLVQLFSSVMQIGDQPVPHEQVAQLSNQALVGGGLALLTVLFAGLALVLADVGTRAWARWGAMATIIVGLLFVIVAALTYVMIPAGSEPQMPEMPAIPQ